MKSGDVILVKNCTIKLGLDKHDASFQFNAPKNGAFVFLALGQVNSENIGGFDAKKILNALGWYEAKESK